MIYQNGRSLLNTMSNPAPYPIASEILETRDRELLSRLSGFYPNEADLQIAEQILVPQLRTVISEALSNFNSTRGELSSVPPAPAELPALCAEVDKSLATNRDLLDSEGLGKPLLDYVRSVRKALKAEMDEAFKAHCRSLLAEHGMVDRQALFDKGVKWFMSSQARFPPFGGGRGFLGLVLGEKKVGISNINLGRLADALGWPEKSETEKLQAYRSALAFHGISDRASLLSFGIPRFAHADFPPYGKGKAFVSFVLGESKNALGIGHFRRIVDALSLPDLSEETQQKYRNALAAHGVHDKNSLLAKGRDWFLKADFPPYGKGHAFAGLILGEVVYDLLSSHFPRIANALGLPILSAVTLETCRSTLAHHGVAGRSMLFAKGSSWFRETEFSPYGNGRALASLLLGEAVHPLTHVHLRRIADLLGWPEQTEKERLQDCLCALAAHGIADRTTLLGRGSYWFMKAEFPPYGKGSAFAGLIIGETVYNLSLDHLRRIADILFPEQK